MAKSESEAAPNQTPPKRIPPTAAKAEKSPAKAEKPPAKEDLKKDDPKSVPPGSAPTHTQSEQQEKIYSTLLKRLIENDPKGDGPADNADAA